MTRSARSGGDRGPVVERLAEALRVNGCAVTGPLDPVAAADALVERAVELALGADRGLRDATVALARADPPCDPMDLAGPLEAAGLVVLDPTDDRWRERLPEARLGITGALLAVASPGALLLDCGPDRPRSVSLVPPVHLCVVHESSVVAELADAFAVLAGEPGVRRSSALTWIGGPSRTGDLEMRMTFGVHGPRAVEVVVVSAR